ncbi:hypothetical protein JHK82_025090 [Glycine max]|nr:hypothetical protein JHK82_025090 [Glycine max]
MSSTDGDLDLRFLNPIPLQFFPSLCILTNLYGFRFLLYVSVSTHFPILLSDISGLEAIVERLKGWRVRALNDKVPLKPLMVALSLVWRTFMGAELFALTEASKMALYVVLGKFGRFSLIIRNVHGTIKASPEGKESEGKLVVKMKEELNLSKDDWDKISELPDNILLHMMNFMDTREAVQTCVLSKRWNNLWKRLTSLLFNSSEFESVFKFNKFLSKFLSDRDDSISLLNVDLDFRPPHDIACLSDCTLYYLGFLGRPRFELEPLNRLMEYAVSRNCQRFSINVGFDCRLDVDPVCFCPSLTILRLSFTPHCPYCKLPKSLQLPVLKTLYLHHVGFTASDNGCAEPFSTCFLLNTLVLECCYLDVDAKVICISNSNLSCLVLDNKFEVADEIVLSTPKLRLLTIKDVCCMNKFSSTCNLSFLEKVYIDVISYDEHSSVHLSWLQLVSNIKEMILSADTIRLIRRVLEVFDSVRIHSPGFVNLETLVVKRDALDLISDEEVNWIVRFLLQNSILSLDKEKTLKVIYTNTLLKIQIW